MPKRFEPEGLPRQRKGITPGMVGRYPDYDVLAERRHWDEVTRKLVLDRVENVPEFRYFDIRERASLEPLCDHITGQVGEEPRIPVLAFVDEKLASGSFDGYQYFDMPGDGQTWRTTARGLDQEARRTRRRVVSPPHRARPERRGAPLLEGRAVRRGVGGPERLPRVLRPGPADLRAVLFASVGLE